MTVGAIPHQFAIVYTTKLVNLPVDDSVILGTPKAITKGGTYHLTMGQQTRLHHRTAEAALRREALRPQRAAIYGATMKVMDVDATIHHFHFNKNQGQWFLSAEEDVDISDVPNASFLVFLKDFLTDSLYRHESIDLPLLMKYYSEEDDGIVEAELSFEEWDEIYRDLPRLDDYMYNVDYGQSLISTNRKSLLLKGLSNGIFMKFHFGFSDGRWQLMEVE